MADARQAGVAARRVDDDHLAIRKLGHRVVQPRPILGRRRAGGIEPDRLDRDVAPHRQWKFFRCGAAILDIAGKRSLAGIEIDAADRSAGPQQRHDQMHGGGRLARPALLVAQDDDMRLARACSPHACDWLTPRAIQIAVS